MEERLSYRETDSYEMVELAYQCESYPEKSYMMRVFLPKRCVPIDELLKAIAADDGKQASIEHVCLYLPRFSVESNIIMTDVLRQIGLEDIFKSTDISPLLADHLQIADIAQRVKIIVNEKETEAAALTSVLDVGCAPLDDYVDDEPIVMTVDRPFLFEIVEKSNEMVLFTGVINDIE
jgi:serpin B